MVSADTIILIKALRFYFIRGLYYNVAMQYLKLVLGFILLSVVSGVGFADTLSDTAKEQRWAEQIIDTLFDGDITWLNAEGHEFLGIEMEATDGSKNMAAIVVHGIGVHPNWEQVVRPLRVELTEHSWHTLSIQMPILPNEAEEIAYQPLFEEVPGRFAAAIAYLQDQGISDIVIVAHSMGAAMTTQYMAQNPESSVKGLILVGLKLNDSNAQVDIASNLSVIKIPVLDLYGSEDLLGVLETAPQRAKAANEGGNLFYSQVMVDDANHFFDGKEDELVNQASDWLRGLR
jgi:pimeloyl-ACP methyl ester carboxylesterase